MEPNGSQKRPRSWTIKFKPLATAPDGEGNMSAVLELVGAFIRFVLGKKDVSRSEGFTLATDERGREMWWGTVLG